MFGVEIHAVSSSKLKPALALSKCTSRCRESTNVNSEIPRANQRISRSRRGDTTSSSAPTNGVNVTSVRIQLWRLAKFIVCPPRPYKQSPPRPQRQSSLHKSAGCRTACDGLNQKLRARHERCHRVRRRSFLCLRPSTKCWWNRVERSEEP